MINKIENNTQVTFAQANAANTAQAMPTSLRDLLMRKHADAANEAKFAKTEQLKTLEPWEQSITSKSEQLCEEYATFKRDFGDRTDAALWQLMQNVYTFVCELDKNANVKKVKAALVKQLKAKGFVKASASNSTAALVVKYIFADQAKQTINNYANVLVKASVLKVPCNKLAAFLKQHGGIVNVLEKYFDEDGNVTAVAQVSDEALQAKVDAQERLHVFKRSLNALRFETNTTIAFHGVQDWVAEDKRKEESKAKDAENVKYKRGDFVFFVAVPGAKEGVYEVVEGFSAAKDMEDKLLMQMLKHYAATTEELHAMAMHYEQLMRSDEVEETQA